MKKLDPKGRSLSAVQLAVLLRGRSANSRPGQLRSASHRDRRLIAKDKVWICNSLRRLFNPLSAAV
jgi:hypothetical protein